MSLFYDARSTDYKTPYGAVPAGETITFHLRPERYFGVTEIFLFIVADDDESTQRFVRARWVGLVGDCDDYLCTYTAPTPGLYWYYFRVVSAQGRYYLSRGYGARAEAGAELTERFQLTVYDGAYTTPDWFGQGITYNIFPDRFHRLEVPAADGYRAPRRIHENWEDTPDYRPDKRGEILNNDFFGGSLCGITAKLDYLATLQVRTLYLNPIFEAFSNHRYDTGDYKKIDPILGTEEDFRVLCEQAKKRGIRVVLDGVFNHTGYDSRYFNGRGHYESVGAHQSQDSPYYNWFDFQHWPDVYSAWWGIYTLPQVRENSGSYQNYIIDSEDSVIRRWLRLGASGWRLDVADELPDWFIARLNTAARQEKSDALILGEVWEDASNKIAYDERRRYFQGGELDSVMNYPLRDAILTFLSGGGAEHFVERIETLRENYPRSVFYSLMNIIGTHDTPRILTVLGSSPEMWHMDRDHRATATLSGQELDQAKRRLWLATVLQFTMPGSPCIYYGDEAGMQGYEDPFNRRPYPWGKEDGEILRFYQTLCAIRAQSTALSRGELRFLQADGALLVFERETEEEWYVIAVNRGAHAREITLPCDRVCDLLTETEQTTADEEITVRIAPERAMILDCGKRNGNGLYRKDTDTELSV